jgi:phosphoribosylaminoimidazole-succinocarboxamide synthase
MSDIDHSTIPRNEPTFRVRVRDVHDPGAHHLHVATERISAFDVVRPTLIPRNGPALTRHSSFWPDINISRHRPTHTQSVLQQ